MLPDVRFLFRGMQRATRLMQQYGLSQAGAHQCLTSGFLFGRCLVSAE